MAGRLPDSSILVLGIFDAAVPPPLEPTANRRSLLAVQLCAWRFAFPVTSGAHNASGAIASTFTC